MPSFAQEAPPDADEGTLLLPEGRLELSVDERTGDYRVAVPADAMASSLADALNRTTAPVFEECGTRTSSAWQAAGSESSTLDLTYDREQWSCVDIPIPQIKGFTLRTEVKKVRTKLLDLQGMASFNFTHLPNESGLAFDIEALKSTESEFPVPFQDQVFFDSLAILPEKDSGEEWAALTNEVIKWVDVEGVVPKDDGSYEFIIKQR